MEQLFGINKADNSVGVFKCKYLVWAVVIAGLLLRLYHLLYNRSLWEDEVYLSTGLVNYDLKHILTQPISFQQKAPLGYLAIVKIIITVFGTSEITLRLFPFICGCLSLLLFVPVIRYFFKPAGYITAIIVIAFSPIVVYHGVEAKQYAVELFSVVLIMYLYIKYHRKSNIKKLLYWGIWGAVIVWCSFASIFALAAMAFAMGITFLVKQRFDLLKGGFIVWGLWFGSFIINYVFFSGKDADTGWLVFFFVKHNGFMPISADTIPWVAQRLVAFVN
jgi:predicted membrane-bound mannosyltransferase